MKIKQIQQELQKNIIASDLILSAAVTSIDDKTDSLHSKNAHIFIVDDEPIVIEVLQAYLEEFGYQHFTVCEDSRQALDLLNHNIPDIVITDLMMPHIDGFELLSNIRSTDNLANLPVLMLTSESDDKTKLKALELGATDFLSKPVDSSELILRIRNNLLVKNYQDELEYARQESDRLLHSILPVSVIDRLKEGEKEIADQFEEVTILFADIVNFTHYASQNTPLTVVNLLSQIFRLFDKAVDEYDLEKIKTVGDAYLLAGGLPLPRQDHANAVVNAAFSMRENFKALMKKKHTDLELRIGIHSGPVTAGVIGTSKVFYDVWGDTVNVASRMESQGVANGIQVSEVTRKLLGEQFLVTERGTLDIRGKGLMKVYLIDGYRS